MAVYLWHASINTIVSIYYIVTKNLFIKICIFFFFCRYDKSFEDKCDSLLSNWEKWDGTGSPFNKSDLVEFQTAQTIQFLALLLKSNNFTLQKLKNMQEAYDFNGNGNCEILLRY